MTDPGPLELKATWIHAYDGNGKPIYTVITTTRNAPTETVTAWEARFHSDIDAAFADPDRRPYQ